MSHTLDNIELAEKARFNKQPVAVRSVQTFKFLIKKKKEASHLKSVVTNYLKVLVHQTIIA